MARKKDNKKTIYFLGAGFSMGAGAPSQAQLMGLLQDFNVEQYIEEYQGLYPAPLRRILPRQHQSVLRFMDSLIHRFPDIDLEDIYTPIDKSILNGTSFKRYSPEKLKNVRESLNALIGLIINKSFNQGNHDYVWNFARHIVHTNRERKKGDRSVVFTTNWDIILDNFIYNTCCPNDVVDYCCHYTSYTNAENNRPPLIAKERGGHTHKVLKLHGSLNWLKCSGCGRLQVGFQEKVALRHYYDRASCRFCGSEMYPEMLMPTFLKQNNNTQLKSVWDQAGVELLEASKIVFMGYSLPMADFEIRHLLSKFIDRRVKVEVVLINDSDPRQYQDLDKNVRDTVTYNLPTSRYERFFAQNDVEFHYDGVEAYINRLAL